MVDQSDRLGSEIDIPFRFKRKPMPIAAELRPDWKIASLLLILEVSSTAGKSSLKRLHILNWALRSARFRREFLEARNNPLPLFGFEVRFEPAFSRAIDLAVGEDFASWVAGNRIQMTPKGKRWIGAILKNDSLMKTEREFLTTIGKSLTEKAAQEMLAIGENR